MFQGWRVSVVMPAYNEAAGIADAVRGFRQLPEVHAGSGYWSENGAVQVFGLSGTPTAVWVRWPGGRETTTPVKPGTGEVVVKQ